jgi:hypothetical protein
LFLVKIRLLNVGRVDEVVHLGARLVPGILMVEEVHFHGVVEEVVGARVDLG